MEPTEQIDKTNNYIFANLFINYNLNANVCVFVSCRLFILVFDLLRRTVNHAIANAECYLTAFWLENKIRN